MKWISGRIAPDLHKKLKAWSDKTGVKLQHILAEALREYLEKRA
jgi:predicted DNA-binding protein